MPKRTRNHRLENISINKFKNLLPDLWVCRSKEQDYGVDLEVEIFDLDGNSTGLMFYVQLKATDDSSLERSVRMKVDRLEYLSSLDAPSMIVRYSDETHAIHFMWITNVFVQIGHTTSKSVTVKFDPSDIWTDRTPHGIPRTLQVLRTIRTHTRRIPIGLTVENDGQSGTNFFELKRAVSKIQSMSSLITNSSNPESCLPIVICVDGDRLFAKIDVIGSIGWVVGEFNCDEILPRLAYILAAMAGRYEFFIQTNELIKIIHENNYTTNCREIACLVAQFALNSPNVAADIASWNSLHEQQDEAYISYIGAMLSSELELSVRKEAIEKFYVEAISSHEKTDLMRASTLHYSLANFQMNWGDFRKAIRHYNQARTYDNSYLERDYFLRETAACLYFSKKYKLAANLYISAHKMSPSQQTSICAGDALLFSGQFEYAAKYYREANEAPPDKVHSSEASLKIWLAEWAADFYKKNRLSGTVILSDRSEWLSVIDLALAEEQYDKALGAALMEAFRVDTDEKLWADAMAFAFNTQNERLILATFSAAIWRCGYEVYALFRENFSKSCLPLNFLETFDQVADAIYERRQSTQLDGVTKRVISPSHYDIVAEMSDEDTK